MKGVGFYKQAGVICIYLNPETWGQINQSVFSGINISSPGLGNYNWLRN